MTNPASSGAAIVLSPRERECVSLMSDGLNDSQTGGRLSISPRTVRFHLDNAMEKLGAVNRPHLVKLSKLAEEAEREANRLKNAEDLG